jgi:TonB family protein
MKKIVLFFLTFPFFIFQSISQNVSDEINPIQKFIESTVQIPFLARVADFQGIVKIRVTMDENNLPLKYEIVDSLRADCDIEALRVIKLVNNRLLQKVLNGKKRISLEVPFLNPSKVSYEKGFVLEYFNKNKRISTGNEKVAFARRYEVDSISGIIKSNVDYFMVDKKEPVRIGLAVLKIDSSERHTPSFLESPSDTLKKYYHVSVSNSEFGNIVNAVYSNGQVISKSVNNKTFSYYPNGRIELETEFFDEGKNKNTKEIKWFSNGQLAYLRNTSRNQQEYSEKYISVWDTLGNQLVKDGNGMDEFVELEDKNILVHRGLIKNGLKEGVWQGKDDIGNIKYVENYEKGNCIKGVAYSKKDSTLYKNPSEAPDFNGGMMAFGRFLQKTLKYPAAAQRSNVSGKVYVQFNVCTDGTVCDLKVVRSVGFGCDDETLRVILLSSGKWKPATVRGKAIKSKHTIPINYQLSE